MYPELWKQAIPIKKHSVTITPDYIRINQLQDDCLMALVFNYIDELCKKLYIISLPCERNNLMNLFNQEKIHCELDGNSNIIIKN